MSSIGDKSIIKRNDLECGHKKKNKYTSDKRDIWVTAFPAFIYGFLYVLCSMVDKSNRFAVELALCSSAVTFTFELNEWFILNQSTNRIAKILNCLSPILFAIVLFILLLFIGGVIKELIYIPSIDITAIPNMLTSTTLFGYFISYSVRQVAIKMREYSQGDDK